MVLTSTSLMAAMCVGGAIVNRETTALRLLLMRSRSVPLEVVQKHIDPGIHPKSYRCLQTPSKGNGELEINRHICTTERVPPPQFFIRALLSSRAIWRPRFHQKPIKYMYPISPAVSVWCWIHKNTYFINVLSLAICKVPYTVLLQYF